MSYVYVDPSHYGDVFEELSRAGPTVHFCDSCCDDSHEVIGAARARAGLHGHFRADGAFPARNLVCSRLDLD